MEKTIWKFKVDIFTDNFNIKMPKDAEILCIQEQYEKPCMWVLVDPNKEKEERYFEIFETGDPIHCDMGVDRTYIGTYQLDDGRLVFHVFERN